MRSKQLFDIRSRFGAPLLAMVLFLLVPYGTAWSATASSVSQHGITWSFDRDYEVGQYANGDWWVVGPVTITRITPESGTVGGRAVHGTMVNPVGKANGWDSNASSVAPSYEAARNLAPSIAGKPLVLAEGSVVSAESSFSETSGSSRGVIERFAILTVVTGAPPSGAFRPDPYGTDKRSYWTESMLDYGILRRLPTVAGAPGLQEVVDSVRGFWNDHITEDAGYRQQSLTARSFQRSYGRDIGNESAKALLLLHLDYSNAAKRDLFVHMVQKGIDIYGVQKLGAEWRNNGGHYGSQKARLMLAAMALNDAGMMAAGDAAAHFVHGMDQQTFYVTQADVDRVSNNDKTGTSGNGCGLSGSSLFESQDLGLPHWGRSHRTSPATFDCRKWGVSYQWIGGSYSGNVLAINLIPGAKDVWNHPALFDYVDRYVSIETGSSGNYGVGTGANQLHPFFANMYRAYRDLAGESGVARPMPPEVQVQ